MKKIFTLMAAACLGVSSLSAITYSGGRSMEGLTVDPQSYADLQKLSDEISANLENNELVNDLYTRDSVDPVTGKTWRMQVVTTGVKLCDALKFNDANGNPEEVTFAEWPMYMAMCYLYAYPQGEDMPDTQVRFYLQWPSVYLYSQIYTYDGPADAEGDIPEDARDYSIVTATELMNNSNYCRTFKEVCPFYFNGKFDSSTGWQYWYILPNLGLQATCTVNGVEGYTNVKYSTDGTGYSTIQFMDYDPDTTDLNADIILQFSAGVNNITTSGQWGTTGPVSTTRVTYNGTARVEGFEPQKFVCEPFASMHLFNAGKYSSLDPGMDGIFTGGDWGPYTALYFLAFDKHLNMVYRNGATAFSPEAVGVTFSDGTNNPDYANMIRGYFFADPKYADDLTLDPAEMAMDFNPGEEKQEVLPNGKLGDWYIDIKPEDNTWISGGYTYGWSQEFGTVPFVKNSSQMPAGGVFQWGTEKGLLVDFYTMYDVTVHMSSVEDIIYHYDPNDIEKTRTFKAIGTAPEVGVEEVAAEASQVMAANGVITVVPAVDAPVAVFALDGSCVMNAQGVAGEAVNVEAAKGVYVVVVGKKASKVVL